jgi:hypothetical protein
MNTNHKRGRTGLKGMALAVLALLFLLPPSAAGQGTELIRDIPQYSDYSIIRQIDYDDWLVYSYGEGNKFYWVTSSNYPVPYKSILMENLKIFDFEIFDNVVYFCGTLLDEVQYAVMGYFSLDSGLYGSVYFDTFPDLASFNKLDIFSVEGQVHLVMTGHETNLKGVMIDVMQTAPMQWIYTVATLTKDEDIGFDDVAVTDSRVVFTSRDTTIENKYGETYLWHFDRPIGIGVNIFLNHITEILFDNEPQSPVLIEHLYNDWFAIACNSRKSFIAISRFLMTSPNATFRYYPFQNGDIVSDIKYNADDQDIDLVETGWIEDGTRYGMCAHIHDSYFISAASTVDLRLPVDVALFSIDYLPGMPSWFIASGHGYENPLLRVYRYKYDYNVVTECTSYDRAYGEPIDVEWKAKKKDFMTRQVVRAVKIVRHAIGSLEINTTCESELEEQ